MPTDTVSEQPSKTQITKKTAMRFIVMIGILSMFADMVYEGARSSTGPFLALLGAGAASVGLIAGLGEFLGYTLRMFTGIITDKTKQYWLMSYLGYAVNLLVVPCLALVNNWQMAAILIVLERVGKAIRMPARDAMVSHAGDTVGRGWGFGLHEALDQTGAVCGPLIIAITYYFRHFGKSPIVSYQSGFALLLIPAILALLTLTLAKIQFPKPQDLEVKVIKVQTKGFSKIYWIYFIAGAFIAAAYADFSLVAYHFQIKHIIDSNLIPVLYSAAMGIDALTALLFGFLYDKKGIIILVAATFISMFFPLFTFADHGLTFAVIGTILWGIGMASQESILKAAIGDVTSKDKRAYAFGLFNTGFGLFWFLGSAVIGFLYTKSIPAVIAFSISLQVIAVILFLVVAIKRKKELQQTIS